MIARIKKLFSDWREDRRRLRALLIQLETLTDPTFLFRVDYHLTFSEYDKARALAYYGIDMDKI